MINLEAVKSERKCQVVSDFNQTTFGNRIAVARDNRSACAASPGTRLFALVSHAFY
jgi:hypothetical protein